MKRSNLSLILLCACLGAALAGAEENAPAQRLQFTYGPRVGVSWVLVGFDAFDAELQEIFPDASRRYIPIFTQFGLNLEQRVRLGNTESHFAFQEVLLLGGLDQGIFLPSLSVLVGFRSRAGLEFGLGPNLSLDRSAGDAGISLAVAFSVGWTFVFSNVFVPVDLALVPSPNGSRLSLLTGFNFTKR